RPRFPGHWWPISPRWSRRVWWASIRVAGRRARRRVRQGRRSSVSCHRIGLRFRSTRCAGPGTTRARQPPYSRGVLLLAIDTATPAVTAGVVSLDSSGALTLADRTTVNPRAYGERWMPHVRDAVADADVGLSDIDVIVCGNGPGPYTGLRAGMVTAAALGHALGIAVYPVGSLDAIAAEVVVDESFLVVTDARRREVYWAEYEPPGSGRALLAKSALP